MSKIISASKATDLIEDEDVVCFTSVGMIGFAEYIAKEIENKFIKSLSPKNLTIVHSCGCGDGVNKGANHFAHEGLTKRLIASHIALAPKFHNLIESGKVEAFLLPQGVIVNLYNNIAQGSPGMISGVGLNTFIDPRLEGAKSNKNIKDDMVWLIKIEEKEWLFYKSFHVDVAIIKATYADKKGNIFYTKEPLILEARSMAQAAKNNGGITIVQVEDIIECDKLSPKSVEIPASCVDYIVVAPKDEYMQTMGTVYNPLFSGEKKLSNNELKISKIPLDIRKIIARRAALEIKIGSVINLGIGIPELVSTIAYEEGITNDVIFTTDVGIYGGFSATGRDFPASYNFDAMIDHSSQFSFYDGGGLDIAFLGLGEFDKFGNCNASKLGKRVIGPGGFINITHKTKKIVFCGTFTAKGLEVSIDNNGIEILNEGSIKKFIKKVSQITFSAKNSYEKNQEVMIITERAVFKLQKNGVLELIEIAPGIDLQKDILDNMEFKPYIADLSKLKIMSPEIFNENWGKLKENIKSNIKEKNELLQK